MAISGALAFVITEVWVGPSARIGIIVGLAIMLLLRRLDALCVGALSITVGALTWVSGWALSWRLPVAVVAFMPAVGALVAGRSRRPLLAMIVGMSGATVAVLGGLSALWPRLTTAVDMRWCSYNLRQLHVCAYWYAEDHDGRLPDASKWCDELLPYIGTVGELTLIDDRPRLRFICLKAVGERSGYAFNQALSKTVLADIRDDTVVLFESDLGWNGTGGISDLAIPPRHSGKSFVLFAAGYSKAVTPAEARKLIWQP